MASTSKVATLSCMHVVYYDPVPRIKDILWCYKCRAYRTCLRTDKSWSIVCKTKDCRFRHDYGTDEGRVRRTAVRHLKLYPDHQVWLRNGPEHSERVKWSGQEHLANVTETLPPTG